MIKSIKEDLIKYLSDVYFNEEWEEVQGDGKFNRNNLYPLKFFSIGNLRKVEKDFLVVQCKSVSGNRGDGLGQLGAVPYGSTATFNVYIEKDVKPSDAIVISDSYIERLYDLIQLWLFDLVVVTPVNPSITIEKYFNSQDNNINSIDKLIIDCDITFTYKASDVNKQYYGIQ